jgi:hypothetical protein
VAADPTTDRRDALRLVIAGLDPAIHVLLAQRKTWMRGSSPRMTKRKPIFE